MLVNRRVTKIHELSTLSKVIILLHILLLFKFFRPIKISEYHVNISFSTESLMNDHFDLQENGQGCSLINIISKSPEAMF